MRGCFRRRETIENIGRGVFGRRERNGGKNLVEIWERKLGFEREGGSLTGEW